MNASVSQQSYIQKYYKKPGMSATIYKENKIGKQHVWVRGIKDRLIEFKVILNMSYW